MITPSEHLSHNILSKYLDELRDIPLLSLKEEREIIRRVHDGDAEAREVLIRSNLRLVVFEAKKYLHIVRQSDFGEIIQAGNLGLISAVDRVNPDFDNHFSTYACKWIKQQIWVHLRELRKLVKIPSKVMLNILSMERVERALRNELGREPTTEEIVVRSNIPIKIVRELNLVRLNEVSIDAPVGFAHESDGVSLGDLIADSDAESLSASLFVDQDRAALLRAINTLTDRERAVIVAHFGLFDHTSETLEEIGKRWKITKEAVWNTEVRALVKLRRSLAPILK